MVRRTTERSSKVGNSGPLDAAGVAAEASRRLKQRVTERQVVWLHEKDVLATPEKNPGGRSKRTIYTRDAIDVVVAIKRAQRATKLLPEAVLIAYGRGAAPGDTALRRCYVDCYQTEHKKRAQIFQGGRQQLHRPSPPRGEILDALSSTDNVDALRAVAAAQIGVRPTGDELVAFTNLFPSVAPAVLPALGAAVPSMAALLSANEGMIVKPHAKSISQPTPAAQNISDAWSIVAAMEKVKHVTRDDLDLARDKAAKMFSDWSITRCAWDDYYVALMAPQLLIGRDAFGLPLDSM